MGDMLAKLSLSLSTRKFLLFHRNIFKVKLANYQISREAFNFNFLDRKKNSPLHVASQFGKHECVGVLLGDEQYRCPLDRRNVDGWMAKDMLQYENV